MQIQARSIKSSHGKHIGLSTQRLDLKIAAISVINHALQIKIPP